MTKSEDYNIICIDGGGTKTKGVLYSGCETVSEIMIGATRVGPVDLGEACDRVLKIIVELCNQAKITTSEIDVVVVGLAGV
jgi:N-acetylglucosamine kinase-like BadF-type ATPase